MTSNSQQGERRQSTSFLESALEQAETLRQEKRQKLDALWVQSNQIKEQIKTIEQELEHLDDHIDQLEVAVQSSSSSASSSAHVHRENGSQEQERDTDAGDSTIQILEEDEEAPENEPARISQGDHSYTAAPAPSPRTSQPSSTSGSASSCRDRIWELLKGPFGLSDFRPHQESIIQSTLQGHNVFCVMRTGGGKSLTYQLPAWYEYVACNQKVTLVVSPLVSLLMDQEVQFNQIVDNAQQQSNSDSLLPRAAAVWSGLSTSQQAAVWRQVRQGDVALLLVTPEKVHKSQRLRSELQFLYQANRLGRFVIDECHCACQWGCDFRPDYAKLGILKRHFPTVPVLAVTATASTRVRDDVASILGMDGNYRFFRSTAHRPNLQYSIRPKQALTSGKATDAQVVQEMAHWILQHYPPPHYKNKAPKPANTNQNSDDEDWGCSGIVYTLSRKDAVTVARVLNDDFGISARAYHSDVSATQKQTIQADWMANRVQVVVATIAFGMGINKPSVRFVLHHCLSKTLEAYYQESGRAGRDGHPAQCVLFYSPSDVIRMRTLVHETHRGEENLIPMIRYAQASGNDAVCKAILMDHLGEPNALNPMQVQKDNDGHTTTIRDVGRHGQIAARLVQDAMEEGREVTLAMVVKQWRSKDRGDKATSKSALPPPPPYVLEYPPAKDNLTVDECERIIVSLLLERILCFHIHWTAYSAVAYLRVTSPLGHQFCEASQYPKMIVRFPLPQEPLDTNSTTTSKNKAKGQTKRVASSSKQGEWLEAKPKAASRKRKSSKTTTTVSKKKATTTTKAKRQRKSSTDSKKTPRATKAPTTKTKTRPKTSASRVSTETEVIELFSDDDDDHHDNIEPPSQSGTRGKTTKTTKQIQESLWNLRDEEDESDEYEFQDDDDE